jgi:hypothetical protein
MKQSSPPILPLGLALAFAQAALAETRKKPAIDELDAAQQAKASPGGLRS